MRRWWCRATASALAKGHVRLPLHTATARLTVGAALFSTGSSKDPNGMCRDAYSVALGKLESKGSITVQNVNGEWMQQTIHEDVFRLWDLSAKVCLVLTHNGNPAVPVSQPVVRDLKHLMKTHHPDNRYRLMARFSQTTTGFEASAAVCTLPHSPFRMGDLVESGKFKRTLSFRTNGNAVYDKMLREGKITNFGRALVIDSVMISESAKASAAILTGEPSLFGLNNAVGMKGFATHDLFLEKNVKLGQAWDRFLSLMDQHWFYACDAITDGSAKKKMVAVATQHGFDLLVRDAGVFALLPAASAKKRQHSGAPRPLTRDGD